MRTTAHIRNTRTARFRRHVTGAILAFFTVLLLATCNDLTLVETMSDLRLEQDNPIDPAWRDGYPAVEAGSIGYDSFSVEFALDTWARVYYGVWPAGVVTDLPDNFCGELRAWAHDGSSSNTSTYADTMLKWGFFDVEDDVVSELISGLDQDTEYEVLAVADRTDQSGAVILQPLRGVWRSPVVTTGVVPWLSAADVDHLTLHISEPAILNGESARFVIRAENADGTVKTDATGMVRLFSTSAGTEIDTIDEVCLLDGGIGYWDIPVTSLMTGQPFEAMFAVNNGDTDDLHDDDTLIVVDTTGFTELTSGFELITGKHYLRGTVQPTQLVELENNDAILVLEPGTWLQMPDAMKISIMQGSVFVLGTEDNPVRISGRPDLAVMTWDGFSIADNLGGANANLYMNCTKIEGIVNGVDLFSIGDGANSSGTVNIANSRIDFNGTTNAFHVRGMSSSPNVRVEIQNNVFVSASSANTFLRIVATHPADSPVTVFHNTIAASIAAPVSTTFIDERNSRTAWFEVDGNIIGNDDYLHIFWFYQNGTNIRVTRNIMQGDNAMFQNAIYPTTERDNLYNGAFPVWTSLANETFVLPSGPDNPSSGADSLIGALIDGHPNEVGAYANFGYPPAP